MCGLLQNSYIYGYKQLVALETSGLAGIAKKGLGAVVKIFMISLFKGGLNLKNIV